MHSATIFFALSAVVASASAGAIASNIIAHPSYKYSYGVSDKLTGDQKSAVEIRDGAVTKGSYSLVQPDGVLRTVNYIVTPLGGFQAQVINKGIAAHPAVLGKGIGAVAAPGLAVGGLGLGLGARGVVGGLGLGGLGINQINGLGLGLGLNGLAVNGLGVNKLGGLVGVNGLGGLVGVNGLGGLAGVNGLGVNKLGGLVGVNGLGGLVGVNGLAVNGLGLGAGLNGLALGGKLVG